MIARCESCGHEAWDHQPNCEVDRDGSPCNCPRFAGICEARIYPGHNA